MKSNFLNSYWRRWNGIIPPVCFAFLVVVMTSCLDDDQANEPIPVAYVSLYHASPNAPELDVFVDDRQVNRLEFTDYTGYLNFYTGNRHFEISPLNASNALIDTTVTFTNGAFYSIFIVNNLSNVETLTVLDSASAPSSGKAKIRFINLSPDAGAFDVTVDESSSPLFAGQAFKTSSNFVELDAAESSFVLKASGGSDELVSVSDAELQAGKFYTIIARGFVTPPSGNNNELSLEIITN